MSGLPGVNHMASIRAGAVAGVDVYSPTPIDAGPTMTWSLDDGTTWAVIWFVAALIILFFVL